MGLAVRLQIEQRSGDRRDVVIPATIRKADAPIDVEIENLSTTGFRATLSSELQQGDTVSVGAAWMGRRTASVVWKMHPRYGFAFDTPLTPNEVHEAQAIENVETLGPPQFAIPPAQATAAMGQGMRFGIARSLLLATAATFVAIGEGIRRRLIP